MLDEMERRGIGEIIDRLMSVPVWTGSSQARKPVLFDLYEAARDKFDGPLTFLAAEMIQEASQKGKMALITTGFVVPPWLRAENDGPVGAVSLARAMNLALDMTSVIVGERVVVDRMPALCRAAGLEVASVEVARDMFRRVALVPFTTKEAEAQRDAEALLDRVQPSVVIAIEKASANEVGQYHSGVGYNISPMAAKVDYVIKEARKRGIPTIGVGDGGNEIGMGCIKDTVKRVIPTGAHCGCPCGAGTHSGTETDLLVVAAVSNWGATAIEANLAAARGRIEVLHDAALEDKLLETAASAGYIDPASGLGRSDGDAIGKSVHLAIVEILNFVVGARLRDSFYTEKYKEYVRDQREHIQKMIGSWEG